MGQVAVNWILDRPWAIQPDMLATILAVAERHGEGVEAVAAKLGRPLDNTRTVEVRDGVAVLPVRGPIVRYADMFTEISGGTSVTVLARDFTEALNNPAVDSILLEVDSPGGQAAGIGELAAMIRAGTKTKPVVAYVSNLGASAGYWIAAAASEVVCAPAAILGSIGVIQALTIPREDAKGPRTIEFVSSQSPNKRANPETDEGKAEIQRTVDALASVFVGDVAAFRGIKDTDVIEKFGRGGVLVGRAAVDAGMANRLGTMESTIADMKRKHGGRAGNPLNPFTHGATAVSSHNDKAKVTHMKLNMSQLLTGWMRKGSPEVIDTAEVAGASSEATQETSPEANDVSKVANAAGAANAVKEVDVEALRARWRAESAAELRSGRVDLYRQQAEAFLSLNSAKIVPAEKDQLIAAFVAGALIDAESPIEGFSTLGGVKASVESRKPHNHTVDFVAGDATDIAEHMNAENLRLLNNAAATPEEEEEEASKRRKKGMMKGSETGRQCLEEEEEARRAKRSK